jgi:hypothetical protein
MSRGVQTFKQGDVTKVLKAAEKAGLKVQRAKVGRDGSILLDFDRSVSAPPHSPNLNEWDEVAG